jgi:hypothetical protein
MISTGRDSLIVKEALATAIVALSRLPDRHRPESNIDDMRKVLADWWYLSARDISLVLAQAECRLDQLQGDAVVAVFRRYGLSDDDDEGHA